MNNSSLDIFSFSIPLTISFSISIEFTLGRLFDARLSILLADGAASNAAICKIDGLIYSVVSSLHVDFHTASATMCHAARVSRAKRKAVRVRCARRWLRHIRPHLLSTRACVRVCGSEANTHACTCELTIERTRFSVSHRRLFPHAVRRRDSLFCSPSRPTSPPRLNPYHRVHRCASSLFLFVYLGGSATVAQPRFAMYDFMVSRRLSHSSSIIGSNREIPRSIQDIRG